MSAAPNPTPAEDQQPPAPPPAEAKPTDSQQEPMIPKSRFDEVNRRLKQLESDQEKRAKEAQQAEEQRLQQQQQFQTLAEQRQQRIAQLEPLEAEVQELRAVVQQQIEQTIKDWPATIKVFDPGADNLKARQEWVAKAAPLVKELQDRPPTPGNGTNPKPVGETPQDRINAARDEQRQSGRYGQL